MKKKYRFNFITILNGNPATKQEVIDALNRKAYETRKARKPKIQKGA